MKQPNIVVVGHVCIDHNVSEHAKYTSWGSGVLYMSKYFQEKLGAHPTIFTQYGPDLLPYTADFELHPAEPPYDKTLIYENTTKDGRRTQRCLNVEASQPIVPDEDEVMYLRQADIVLLAPLLPNYSVSYVKDLLAQAPKEALKILCPQGYFRQTDSEGRVSPRAFEEAKDLLPLFDVALFSDEDYPNALSVAQGWKGDLDTHIVVTQGPKGASIILIDGPQNIPTHPVPPEEIVDSVGCGDVFSAALAYELYKTKNLTSAIKAGHKVAHDKLLSINTGS